MRDLAASALSGGADAVLIIANALDTAALAQQLRLLSSAVPLFGAEWGFTNDVVVNGGRAVEGAVFMQKVNLADETPRFQVFRRGYEARYSRSVDFAAVMAYESVKLLGAALEQDATREGVRAAVLRLGAFEGLQGTVRIDEHGDAERRHYVMTIRGGRVVPVE
jgi:branched-chain amino acid transport system substrate-binding protein